MAGAELGPSPLCGVSKCSWGREDPLRRARSWGGGLWQKGTVYKAFWVLGLGGQVGKKAPLRWEQRIIQAVVTITSQGRDRSQKPPGPD